MGMGECHPLGETIAFVRWGVWLTAHALRCALLPHCQQRYKKNTNTATGNNISVARGKQL